MRGRQRKQEERERKAREKQERKEAHIREVTCMDLPLDWEGCCMALSEELANGIPVLWLINNEDVDPPWGKVARMKG